MRSFGSPILSLALLSLSAAACGDDSGGGTSAGGGGSTADATSASSSSSASATIGSTSASTTASTTTSTTGTTTSTGSGGAGGDGGGSVEPFVPACPDVEVEEEDLGAGGDPEDGDFTLEEALVDLPAGDGALRAMITTAFGTLSCELFPEAAPIGVANFVGLARGLRPWLDPETDTWVRGRRFYDGLIFHRVIPDFMAQGGDPLGSGFGDPGYEFVNETGELSHVPGALSYANAGPDTNGSQFFVVAGDPQTHLDGGYTVFGLCAPVGIVTAITEVDTDGNDKPLEDIVMQVHISRCEG